jgi:hypothetical protein
MTPDEGSLLPDRDWDKLQQIADQFAAARLSGPVDDWLPFVPAMDDPLHRPVLLELIKIDLEVAWRAGSGPLVESFASRFPELDPMPIELIVEEYRVRQHFGDKPALESYQARFPEAFSEFPVHAKQLPAAPSQTPAAAIAKMAGAAATPATPADPATPPLLPDGYKPVELLGRGCFGEVWRAEAPGGIEAAQRFPCDDRGAEIEKAAGRCAEARNCQRLKKSTLRGRRLRSGDHVGRSPQSQQEGFDRFLIVGRELAVSFADGLGVAAVSLDGLHERGGPAIVHVRG